MRLDAFELGPTRRPLVRLLFGDLLREVVIRAVVQGVDHVGVSVLQIRFHDQRVAIVMRRKLLVIILA